MNFETPLCSMKGDRPSRSLSLDDVQDQAHLSFSFITGRTGLADATVRKT
jgi:hypothetical protein